MKFYNYFVVYFLNLWQLTFGVFSAFVLWFQARKLIILPLLLLFYLGVRVDLPVHEFEPISVHLDMIWLLVAWLLWKFSYAFVLRSPSKFGRSELAFKKKWLSVKELPRFIKYIVILMPTTLVSPKSFYVILRRILRMWNMTGTRFTIFYWAEVYRTVLLVINGGGLKDPKFAPKLTKRGIPKVLPVEIREFIWNYRQALIGNIPVDINLPLMEFTFKKLSTILCFFRACCPAGKVRVSWSSIVTPFTGVSTTLDYQQIFYSLSSMGFQPIRVGKPSLLRSSSKSGPNSSNAVLGLGMDIIAWVQNPRKWINYVRMCYHLKFRLLLLFFVISSLLLSPVALVAYILRVQLLLGRIAILSEARGKMRKVGICDWWTQTLFKPLHDSIYSALSNIPQDGTNDQTGPIMIMMRSLKYDPYTSLESLDLSDATDRLPIDVQVQILNMLGFPGDLWRSILSREWCTPSGGFVSYAVGQPMGAYSSFAMLALTQHVLMHMALINAKQVVNPCHLPEELIPKHIKDSAGSRYSILGDDSAVDNVLVAKAYTRLLTHLGVVVNPIKGFSGSIVEFAKQVFTLNQWEGGRYCANLSPLGAKNILLAIRYPLFLSSVLQDMFNKDFDLWKFVQYQTLFDLILTLFPGNGRKLLLFGNVPKTDLVFRREFEKRRDWVNAIVATAIGPYSGIWQLNSFKDSSALCLWAETIFIECLRRLNVRISSQAIFLVIKHWIISSAKRPTWWKNIKGLLSWEIIGNHLWALIGKPLNWSGFGIRGITIMFGLVRPVIGFFWTYTLSPGVVPYGYRFDKYLAYILIPKLWLIYILHYFEIWMMFASAIFSHAWLIVLYDLLRKLSKQLRLWFLWLLSDLFKGDFAKKGFQGYNRDSPVKYHIHSQVLSSEDTVPKYRVTTKGGPLKYSDTYGDNISWNAMKFASFVKLIVTFEPIENLASKSIRDYRSEVLSSAFIKMLLMFLPYSPLIKKLHFGTSLARKQLKVHLTKSRVIPKDITRIRLLNAPLKPNKYRGKRRKV